MKVRTSLLNALEVAPGNFEPYFLSSCPRLCSSPLPPSTVIAFLLPWKENRQSIKRLNSFRSMDRSEIIMQEGLMSPWPLFSPLLCFPMYSKVFKLWNWTGLQKLSPLYIPKADNLHTTVGKRKLPIWAITVITEINAEYQLVCNYKYGPRLSRETLVSSYNSGLSKENSSRPSQNLMILQWKKSYLFFPSI